MKKLLFSFLFFFPFFALHAQPAGVNGFQTNLAANTNLQAKNLVEKVKNNYPKTASLKIEFSVKMGNKNLTKGTLFQKGDKFYVEMPDQSIYSDGKNTWTVMKKEKEVIISNAAKSEAVFLTPYQFLTIYERNIKKIKYNGLVNTPKNGGKKLEEIELSEKCLDFSKITASIDENNTIYQITTYSQTGENSVFEIISVSPTNSMPDKSFSYTILPTYKVDDRRF